MAGGFTGAGGSEVSSVAPRFWAGFLSLTAWGFLSFRSGSADCRDSVGSAPFVEGSLVVFAVAQPPSRIVRLSSSTDAKLWKREFVIDSMLSPTRAYDTPDRRTTQ